jgi:hypothetical protein
VFNVLGYLITTNHLTDGIYLPADDRRHYVAWSRYTKDQFAKKYWNRLWRWYLKEDGFAHVAAYLGQLDISTFDPNAPPPKTPAFWDIVNASRAPEDSELADVIDALGNPDVLYLDMLIEKAKGEIAEWLMTRKNRRALPHRFERCGYVSVQNLDAKDGLWKIKGERRVVYAKAELTPEQRLAAARRL